MARKDSGHDDEGGGHATAPWLGLYISLMIILIAFFVVLNSYAVKDKKAIRKGISSLRGSFGGLSGGFVPIKFGKGGRNLVNSVIGSQKEESSLEKFLQEFETYIKGIDALRVYVERDDYQLKMTFPGDILFKTGSAEIEESTYPVLDKIIDEMQKYTYPIIIEGHADDAQAQNTKYPSNWKLSMKRAVNITEYFESKGILSNRLRAVGFSKYESPDELLPIYDESMNRRIDIILLFKSKEDELNYGKQKTRDKSTSFAVDVDFR
jgi:chemotaxis protein MotB